MGFVTLGLFVFTEQGLQGAILQMINHGLITGALFLLVGVIYERTHDRTIAKMGGLSARTPVWAAIFGFFVFASAGLPGLSGFVGEFLVLVGTFLAFPGAAAVATFVMILSAAYLLFMYQRVIFGEVSAFLEGLGHHLTDISPIEILTVAPLGVLVVVFGIQPGLLLNLFASTVTSTLAVVKPAAPIAIPNVVTIVVVAIVLLAVLARIGWALLHPQRPVVVAEGGAAH
jgi:NADH-quinone oxidoreductase subunit M